MPPLLIVLLFPAMVLIFAGYIGLRMVRAFERRAGASHGLNELQERLRLIEQQLDAQNGEIARLAEGQQFTQKLIESRPRPDESP